MTSPTVISLFTGMGGLDFGLQAAGFRTAVGLEFDADCCLTLRRNTRWRILEKSILDTSGDDLLEASGLRRRQPDLLAGGPPCQPFSKSGWWRRGTTLRLDDPRANTLAAFMRVWEETLPRVVLLENVEGLAYADQDEGLKLILRRIEQINKRCGTKYRPTYSVLNAASYGAPQLRERFILVASREGLDFRFPTATHAPDGQGGGEPYRTAWDAIGGLVPGDDETLAPTGKWARLLPSIPEGQNYLWHTERGGGRSIFGWRTRYWSFLLKLAKSLPSWTLQANPGPSAGPFHWDNRRLALREMCRLQTLPDGLAIAGTRFSQQRQVGNAVPSLLAEVLGRAIAGQLLGRGHARRPLRLLPPKSVDTPSATRVRPVPAEYLELVGRKLPHPGEGLGPGARRTRVLA